MGLTFPPIRYICHETDILRGVVWICITTVNPVIYGTLVSFAVWTTPLDLSG